MTKKSTKRVNGMRDRAKQNGWVRRDYYATPDEHDELKRKLAAIRRRTGR